MYLITLISATFIIINNHKLNKYLILRAYKSILLRGVCLTSILTGTLLRSSVKSNVKSRKKSRAQVSVEYLIIIGISFAILIPAGYFFYSYSKNSNDATIRSQIAQTGSSIITTAESIYGLGEGSLVTLNLRYPDNIRDVYILNGGSGENELVIKYELSSGMNEAVFFSKVSLSGNYTYPGRSACSLPCQNSSITPNNITEPGSHKLKFESKTSYVLIVQSK